MQQQPPPPTPPAPSIFPKASGNYRALMTYQKAEAIFDITYYFCGKYLKSYDRTIGQMEQAARSGKQNIIEGCAASATSKETEIKLVNVAKASSLELLADYEDYLRTRNLRQWEMDSVEMIAMRKLGRKHNNSAFYMPLVQVRPPETIANMAIVLIRQNDTMLHNQLLALEQKFLQHGGLREQMFKARTEQRNAQKAAEEKNTPPASPS